MSDIEERCSFALTSQRAEGTIALLDVTVELRKILTSLEHNGPEGPAVMTTTRRFAQTQILHDGDIVELEGSEDDEPSRTEEVRSNPIREIHTQVVDITSSDDEEEEAEPEEAPSEASEETERNFNLPPPPYSQEDSRRQQRDRWTRLRSPSPPGYVPLTFFQNVYSPLTNFSCY